MNHKEIDVIVNEINSSDIFVRLFEVGAGLPVSSILFSRSGSSKTVFSSESLYSRLAFDKKFGISTYRAVCPERLKIINDSEEIHGDIATGLYNTVYSSTYQVGDHNISTHGWVSLKTKNKIRYYHISLHSLMQREDYIKTFGEIGLKILQSRNEESIIDSYIDIVLDENLEPLVNETLNMLSHQITDDTCSVFTVDGNIERMEYLTRDHDSLIVYKGSFNPPTIAHNEIMKLTIEKYPKSNYVFCINVDTYQKGQVTVDSLSKRIKYLNMMGYDVVISIKPLFVDTIKLIHKKFDGIIVFPVGMDTAERISDVYSDTKIRDIKRYFNNCDIIVYERIFGEEISENTRILFENNIFIKGQLTIHQNVSSTLLREAIKNGDNEILDKYLPEELKPELIKIYEQEKI